MSKVSIIGAGEVGATVAYTLQLLGLATEIVLVDVRGEVAEGHVLDMNHGLFFTAPVSLRAGGYPDCRESQLVIITAGARQKPGETRLALTRRNTAICREIMGQLSVHLGEAKVLILCNPVDVMTWVALESTGLSRQQVLGSGTVLDSARFRYELSRRCRVDPRNVHAYVAGEHGDSEVFLWSEVHIAGTPLAVFCRACELVCDREERDAIEKRVRDSAYHIIEAKGYTNFGVSLAVSRIVGAVLRDERSVLTVSTYLDGEYGMRDVCVSVPCVVGASGIERIVETRLSGGEAEGLVKSGEVVRGTMRSVARFTPCT